MGSFAGTGLGSLSSTVVAEGFLTASRSVAEQAECVACCAGSWASNLFLLSFLVFFVFVFERKLQLTNLFCKWISFLCVNSLQFLVFTCSCCVILRCYRDSEHNVHFFLYR